MGRFDAAIASLQQASTLDPRNSALAFELGLTYMQTSRFAEAEQAFQRALALDGGLFQRHRLQRRRHGPCHGRGAGR
jgi:Flp pilus assembly protein TadD